VRDVICWNPEVDVLVQVIAHTSKSQSLAHPSDLGDDHSIGTARLVKAADGKRRPHSDCVGRACARFVHIASQRLRSGDRRLGVAAVPRAVVGVRRQRLLQFFSVNSPIASKVSSSRPCT
jgi:hypothetical protein